MGIYVEAFIRGDMEELWQKTQTPDLHQRWDLRFSDIQYLPRPDEHEPQAFLYATRIGFGLAIRGGGKSVGSSEGPGRRTSALQFWSGDGKSLISEGSGYWSYLQTSDGIRFLTWYDYRTRFNLIGRIVDRVVFRPLMGWATAWSFDRLRLWIERGIDPASSLRASVVHGLARLSLAFIWLYQGLVPKLLFTHHDELTMLLNAGISPGDARPLLRLLGVVEVAFGALMLVAWRSRWLFVVNVALMLLATAGVIVNSPQYLDAAFNPITLNAAVIALALVGFISSAEIPFASRCLRKPKERGA